MVLCTRQPFNLLLPKTSQITMLSTQVHFFLLACLPLGKAKDVVFNKLKQNKLKLACNYMSKGQAAVHVSFKSSKFHFVLQSNSN